MEDELLEEADDDDEYGVGVTVDELQTEELMLLLLVEELVEGTVVELELDPQP